MDQGAKPKRGPKFIASPEEFARRAVERMRETGQCVIVFRRYGCLRGTPKMTFSCTQTYREMINAPFKRSCIVGHYTHSVSEADLASDVREFYA